MVERVSDRQQLAVPVGERDHLRGPATAPLTLLEYGDFECPYCGAAYPVVKELERMLGDELRFVFRHFPLSQSHPHAFQAGEAAEAAGAQGRFWELHDILFENQQSLTAGDLVVYAQAIGLELERFAADLAEHRHARHVREDFMSGVRSGVSGTPTFFVNGVRHDGANDVQSLLDALRNALRKA